MVQLFSVNGERIYMQSMAKHLEGRKEWDTELGV